MFLVSIIAAVIIIIWFIIWRNRKRAEENRVSNISEEKQQGEKNRLEEKMRLKTEERASRNQEERKLRAEQDANAGKVREERDVREQELRQKIADRKKHESEEGQYKVGE